MARLFKRKGSPNWHFDFRFGGERFQGTTHLKNKEKAESYVAKFRADLALGLVGLTHREPPPILSVFLQGKFLDSCRQHAKKPRTLKFYERCVKRLCEHVPFTQMRHDRIDELAVQAYKDFRLAVTVKPRNATSAIETAPREMSAMRTDSALPKHLSPSTINGELRTLRKALKFAESCDLIRYRGVRTLPGEKNRTFILDGETERRYLELAQYPLKQVAILMLDLGLRPEEAVSLRKLDIADDVNVRYGKTPNARRSLPQTQRTREVFQLCTALFPSSEWVFPGSKGGHYTPKWISDLHIRLRKEHGFPPEFCLYACRHTYGTRLAESGASPFEIGYLMGHSSVKVSERYIHFGPASVAVAAKRKEAMDRLMRGEEVHEEASSKAKI